MLPEVASLAPPLAHDGSSGRRKSSRRALSLDALRGMAILGMVLSGLLPFWNNTLPSWMYHAQLPPPTHAFNPSISGMTWVDLVFPLFLFALGAAVPLALAPKLDRGISRIKLGFSALMRGLLLLFFALYEQHLAPGELLEVYGKLAYGIGPLGFLVLFAIFTRLPARWPSYARAFIRIAGWASAIALLATLRYADGSGFTVHRHDIIIVILANVAVSTALIWLWSPFRYTGRLCIMAVVITAHVARHYSRWGTPVTNLDFLRPLMGDRIFEGIIWACSPTYQKYLLITLPGTIAGDVLVTWLRPGAERLSFSIQNSRWRQLSLVRCACLAIVCAALVAGTIIGFSLNDLGTTVVVILTVGGLGFMLLYSPPARSRMKFSSGGRSQQRVSAVLFRALFTWGMIWLVAGLALYPYQDGIRKDPATLSYLFTTAGLAHLALIVFAVFTEAMHRRAPLFLLIDNGQNPMIAYVAWSMFVIPIMQLIPVGDASLLDWLISVTSFNPWAGFARALVLLLMTAVLVSGITRLRIFWRT